VVLALPLGACKAPEEPTEGRDDVQPAVKTLAVPDSLDTTTPNKVVPDKSASTATITPRNTPYYYSGNRVLRVESNGKHEVVTKFANLRFCVNDPRHDALWLLGSRGLAVYDIAESNQELVVKAPHDGSIESFEIRFGDGKGRVGNANPEHDMASLVLMLTSGEVSLRGEALCEGDLSNQCFVEEGDDPDFWKHTPALKSLLARYKSLELRQEAEKKLATLASRFNTISTDSTDSTDSTFDDSNKTPPDTGINKSRCTGEADECGTGEFLGNNYWRIITGNSRGDFLSETYSLFDAKRNSWVSPSSGLLVKDPANAAFELTHLAPDRSSLLTAKGSWFSLTDNETKLVLKAGSHFCGYGRQSP